MIERFSSSLRRTALLVLTVSLLSGAAAAAVTVTTLNTNPVEPGSGTLSEASALSIDGTDLAYEGTNVTSIDITISNTGTSDATTDIHVALLTDTGSVVEQQTLSGKTITSSSTATFTVSLSSDPGVDEFAELEATVERTA